MAINYTQLSKTISHALRHEPWVYELELDDEGWVSVDALLSSLQMERDIWKSMSITDLYHIIEISSKKRFEISGKKIRALYGHSLPGKLNKRVSKPPDILYHGTAATTADIILKEGLKPMNRHYVHLSVDQETAKQVAYRKSKDIEILKIHARAACLKGIKFYIGNEHVWLADIVSAEYITN